MSEAGRIADQLKRAYEGEAWHGPSLRELLADVTAEQAASKPVSGAHSAWEIVLHIAAWETAGRRRLEGDRAELSDAEDWPTVTDESGANWSAALAELERSNRVLREAVAGLDDAVLESPIFEDMSSVYVTLHGVVQHTLYHAGQIAVLKKAWSEKS